MASTLFGRPPAAYDSERLVVEVANSVYAVRNHISIAGLRQLWNGLANFINVSLKSHKVVLWACVPYELYPCAWAQARTASTTQEDTFKVQGLHLLDMSSWC